jgi:hypothetical protein
MTRSGGMVQVVQYLLCKREKKIVKESVII